MFTLPQLKAAHAKVKTGADFPAYVQEIKQMGLQYYEFKVTTGQTTYHGADGFTSAATQFIPTKPSLPMLRPQQYAKL